MSDEIREMDKYDLAIKYLTEHPEEIYLTWNAWMAETAGCLFMPLSRSGKWYDGDTHCGCPTMVRDGFNASTPELTEIVRADERIPRYAKDITLESLPAFATIQRLADTLLGR